MAKKRRRNPFEPGLSRHWYQRGRAAAVSGAYMDMYGGWHAVKSKPTTPGGRVTAQESFYQGYMDMQEQLERKHKNPLPIGKWFKASIQKLRGGKFKVKIPGGSRFKNPFEPGLNRRWYIKGRVAAKKPYADMYAAWHAAKGKPTTPGGRVTAQESFYQGFMDVR